MQQTDAEKIRSSFPNHDTIFTYNANGQVSGLNERHGLIANQQYSVITTILSCMLTVFDCDRTRANDHDRATQRRLGEILIGVINRWIR